MHCASLITHNSTVYPIFTGHLNKQTGHYAVQADPPRSKQTHFRPGNLSESKEQGPGTDNHRHGK